MVMDPIVEIAQGKLKGSVKKTAKHVDYYSFKGIPYAKPPVGDLRFSVPVAPEAWEGIKDASQDVNASPQYNLKFDNYIGNEDCLFLNVYTPKLPGSDTSLLPVMFYIHGGGFLHGQGTDDSNNGPDFLIEKEVVLVAINYRLGILGFLTLNCKEASGNMGLKDQVRALKWVQQNIAQFNGDPNNVTVFGLSAGGASVEYLMLSPTAKGLFHKAIAQCGSSLCSWAQYNKVKQLAYKTAALNGKEVSNDQELLNYLKGLDIKELVVMSMKALESDDFRGGIHFGFVPVIEEPGDWEPFLEKKSFELLKTGEFNKVPFVAGFATHEALPMILQGKHIFDQIVNEKKFAKVLPLLFDTAEEPKIEEQLKHVYMNPGSNSEEADAFAIDYLTDVNTLGPVYIAASLIAMHNPNPVYFYEFTYDGNFNYLKKMLNINRKGACHCDELGYLVKIDILHDEPTPEDVDVRERMVTMWTNLAKYGNPTPKIDNLLSIKWEPMTAEQPACLVIDEALSMKQEVYPSRVKLFKQLYDKYRPSNLS